MSTEILVGRYVSLPEGIPSMSVNEGCPSALIPFSSPELYGSISLHAILSHQNWGDERLTLPDISDKDWGVQSPKRNS